MNLIAIGLDIAKSVFQVHRVDTHGKSPLRKQLRRSEVLRGLFEGSAEELTPVSIDWWALIPVATVGALLLMKPTLWARQSASTIAAYAATPAVVQLVHQRI
jgi:hypothetical protein